MKQKELSVCLRVIVPLAAVGVIVLAAVFIPQLGRTLARQNAEQAYYVPCLVWVWVSVLPVLAALAVAWRIFADIGRDMSFSLKNAARLRLICYLAIADTVLYIALAGTLAALNVLHTGIFVVLLCVIFMGFFLSVAAAALSHLTRKAAALKDENDLTI